MIDETNSNTYLDSNMKSHMRKTINVMNYENEKEVVQDLNSKEVCIKDRELAHFWERRAKDSSLWSMLLNSTNLLI